MSIFPTPDYGDHYSPEKLFDKLKKLPGRVLTLVLVKAFLLYELLKKRNTPVVVKAAIIGALGYLICPLDAVPDLLPGGYADDIALMAGLIASIDYLISHEMKRKAEDRAAGFTDDDEDDEESEEDEK